MLCRMTTRRSMTLSLLLLFSATSAFADDQVLQWGGSPQRNNVSDDTGLPTEWDAGSYDYRARKWDDSEAVNLKWSTPLGSECYGQPVVTADKVLIATNNSEGLVERLPKEEDLGVMLAFDRETGAFLWQYASEKLPSQAVDWPEQGICSTPLVEGDRMWLVSNRNEIVCLDVNGFLDGENDGPVKDEHEAKNEADVIWRYDMLNELGAVPHNMACTSPTSYGDLLFVGTSNGATDDHKKVVAPDAPSFIAVDKNTGKLVWTDNSPGENILDGQWSSPAVGVFDGVPQVIFPGGDGWLYSFLAEPTDDGKAKLLWKFDGNPKNVEWEGDGYGDRNYFVATPVIDDGKVYIATGQDPENGEGQGDLWCIDPTKRGDVSAELVIDANGAIVPPGREKAIDEDAGQKAVPNPNSAVIWHYQGLDADGDGRRDFEETFHRSLGMVAIQDGLLVIGDGIGLIHCLDAKTAEPLWTHDTMASIWGSPLIADGKIYLGDDDGDICVFALSREMDLLAENLMGDSAYAAPVAAGGDLYIATRGRLYRLGVE